MDQRETDFREVCKDTLQVIDRLKSQCRDFDEMAGLLSLAVGDEQRQGNDAQLRILMALVLTDPKAPQPRR